MTRGHRLPTLKARRLAGGLTIGALARLAAVSDLVIIQLENGGNCDPQVTQQLLNALGPPRTIATSSIASPSVITTSAAHSFVSTDTLTIAGHTGSTPAVDGERVATVTAPTTFTVPINVTGGGSGGTAQLSPTTLGRAAL